VTSPPIIAQLATKLAWLRRHRTKTLHGRGRLRQQGAALHVESNADHDLACRGLHFVQEDSGSEIEREIAGWLGSGAV
jgi:hypothetical protein